MPISGLEVEPPENNVTDEEAGRAARWIFKSSSPPPSETKSPEKKVSALPSMETMEAPAGFQVFGPKLRNRGRHTKVPSSTATTNNHVRFYAEPQDDSDSIDSSDSNVGGGGGSSDSESLSEPLKELTIKVPKFDTDEYGGRVYNPWGVTFGSLNLDTRFRDAQFDMPRMSMEMNPVTNYYPDSGNMSTVCANASTVYNEIKVEKWLVRHIYNKRKKERAFFMAFRREIYDMANSEECHTEELDDWLAYQECALRRNQRMEYYIPEYPRQQIAFN